jgi:hypothetical protein
VGQPGEDFRHPPRALPAAGQSLLQPRRSTAFRVLFVGGIPKRTKSGRLPSSGLTTATSSQRRKQGRKRS